MYQYQPKVNNTEQYSDSQGDHIVCRGKLILLKNEKPPADVYIKGIYGKHPIIISETEEIKEGDAIINDKELFKWDNDMQRFLSLKHKYIKNKRLRKYINIEDISLQFSFNKILALPEHFSDKHLQAIVDGKMKDGDEVLVKCGDTGIRYYIDTVKFSSETVKIVHLDQQNHITLFPVKQSLEEAAENYKNKKAYDLKSGYFTTYNLISAFKAGAKWAKKNNY